MRLPARPLDQLESGEFAGVVVKQEQVEVAPRALDVRDGVAVIRARLDVLPGEFQHVLHGLEQHPILFDVENYCGMRRHTSS